MKRHLLIIALTILYSINSNAQGIGPIPGSQIRGTSEILGGLMVDSLFKLPIRALTAWPYANNKMPAIGLLQVNSVDTLPYYLKSGSTWKKLLTTDDTTTFGHVNSVSGTLGRINSTGGVNPVIDLVTANSTPATSGSGTAIPVITYDAYGRLTTVTTVSPTNPTITLSGDVSGSGTTAITTTLTTVNASPGTFGSATAIPIITVDSKGRATTITTVSPSTTGLVTSVSVVSANGFAGTVANATSTPAITLTTTVNAAVVKGNGTALIPAVSGTDYQAPGNYITALTGDVTAAGPGSAASTIATVNPNTGTFGSASVVPQITFNAKGQATAVTTVAISTSPSGAAGGDLTGTYPNPTIVTVNASPATYGSSTAIPVIAVNSKGQATTITTSVVVAPAGTLSGATLAAGVTASSLISVGIVTGGTWSTGAVIGTPTMTLGSDASFDMYYRNGSGILTRLGNGTTGQVMTATTSSAPSWASPAAAGTVTSVSVVTANGFSGTVATATTIPAITIQTTLNTPVIAGNGTALIAATTTGTGSTVALSAGPTFTGTAAFQVVNVQASTSTFGGNTGTSGYNLGGGATTSGNTKTLNIGTGGLAGSTTVVMIGGTAGTSTTTMNGITTIRIAPRVTTAADATSITPTGDATDITSQTNTQAIGNLTINAPTGTPQDGQTLQLRIKSTNIQTFIWNVIYVGCTTTSLPTASTGASKTDIFYFQYNTITSKWAIYISEYGY